MVATACLPVGPRCWLSIPAGLGFQGIGFGVMVQELGFGVLLLRVWVA